MSYRQDFQAADRPDEELANMLAMGGPQDTRRAAAEAELRLREHRAILRQAEAAEKSALAAERAASATVRYVEYTFWILVAALVTAAVSLGSYIWTLLQRPH
jgi:hypothetical protein